MSVISGSNEVYAIAENQTEATIGGIFGTSSAYIYGYNDRLIAFSDTLTGGPTLSSPKWFIKTGSGGGENVPQVAKPTYTSLSWSAVSGATKYEVWYSTSSTFSTTTPSDVRTHKETTTKTTFDTRDGAGCVNTGEVNLKPGTTYYWKVRVATGEPLLSRWSASWKFNTPLDKPSYTVSTIVPALGAVDVSLTPSLAWPKVTGAVSYDFVIGEDPTFAIINYAATEPTNAHVCKEALKYDTTYYWRVRATGQTLGTGGQASTEMGDWITASFTTKAAPEVEKEVWICPHDGLKFDSEAALKEHLTKYHAPAEKKYECTQCGRIFTSQTELWEHWEKWHRAEPAPPAIPDYLLWTIIGIGAVLVICLIVLIVRTRRVA
jgi:hypothetical protein